MDVRVWITQIVALLIGFLNVAVLAIVSWHYADTGNVGPGLTIFGAGAVPTAGAYGVGRAIGNKRTRAIGAPSTELLNAEMRRDQR